MLDRPREIKEKKHWLKRPKAVPPKMKFAPKYKWFKILDVEFFFFFYMYMTYNIIKAKYEYSYMLVCKHNA